MILALHVSLREASLRMRMSSKNTELEGHFIDKRISFAEDTQIGSLLTNRK